jgi:hypothetical protein
MDKSKIIKALLEHLRLEYCSVPSSATLSVSSCRLYPLYSAVLIIDESKKPWIVYVPNLDDRDRSVAHLFDFFEKLRNTSGCLDINFNFNYCRFLGHIGVAFLGGLAHWIVAQGGRVQFAWETLAPKIYVNLGQSGFLESFGVTIRSWEGNSIPYRCDRIHQEQEIGQYLRDAWLGRGWVNVSPGIRDAISGQAAEIYLNAFEHSRSAIGVFSCGQHYPTKGRLELAVIDFGIGIPASVRSLPQNQQLTASQAINWAFQNGTSTKGQVLSGSGLNLLQSFVMSNQGNLRIFSGDGSATIEDNGITYKDKCTRFSGTLVNISLLCDESYYCLSSEVSPGLQSWF